MLTKLRMNHSTRASAAPDAAARLERVKAHADGFAQPKPPGWFEPHGTARPGDFESAIAAMREAYAKEPGGHELLSAWVDSLRADQARGVPVTVMGHSAITLLLRKQALSGTPELERALHDVLGESWRRLTGQDPGPEQRLSRLPKKVLSGADRLTRDFHASVFQSDDVKVRKQDPRLFSDYVPERNDPAYALLMLGALSTEVGLELLGGGALGVVLHSYLESFFHNHAGHATKETLAMAGEPGLRGLVGREFAAAEFGHHVHHQTFRNHVVQFKTPEEKARMVTRLLTHGEKGQEVIDSEFGVTVTKKDMLRYLRPNLVAAAAAIVAFKLSPLAVIGLALPTVAPVFASKVMHPYLHMKTDEAAEKAGPVMRALLKTRYLGLVKMLHYLHHKGGLGNHNIQPPIGDWLTNELQKPNTAKMLEMYDLGML